ncbi:hypothetical protein BP6252_01380 [Coleophoma cylindrospora]|uniref:Telomerase activating protein Est1 n=1 Tax=Coleophoma cylindrospora TaxID=1849047 RepID=A0A3D8SU99_9HELO|nr:hypothetical protein BP6252_01380 [Coleophoma cylindrospora]
MEPWKLALQTEQDLKAQLKKDHPLFDDVEHLILQMRVACEATIFADFEFATKQSVELHLWDSHSVINNRYRKLVNHFRSGDRDQKKYAVERRKLEKRYADFIKTSQFFYKGYIQRLASHFTGLQDLRRIAHQLSLDSLTVDQRVQVSPEVEQLITLSCYNTLLHLGDLSRYRNLLRVKDRSWETALTYYRLACELHPNSGSSQNQMAVIALADQNHLDALYYLYRAIAVEDPYPLAKANIEIEFKKILNAWEKGPTAKGDNAATLVLWFVRLHAKFYKGVDFATREELENEVLHQLAVQLKEDRTIEATLERFVIINVAAEYTAGLRYNESQSENAKHAFFFILGFNVRTLFLLLQILQPELEDPAEGEDLPSGTGTTASDVPREKITVITRRVLPALRHYSTWLVSRVEILVAVPDLSVQLHLKELFKIYADVLTRLANFFPVVELPEVNYLLEEDETTIGFKPFRDGNIPPQCNLYHDENGLKPRMTDPGIKRSHPNIEMQARVRDIMLCGLTIAVDAKFPVSIDQTTSTFNYVEAGLPATSPVHNDHQESSLASVALPQPKYAHTASNYKAAAHLKQYNDDVASVTESARSMETFMHDMVDSLLEPSTTKHLNSDETSYGMHSHTANEVFAVPDAQNGTQNHRQSFSTPKMLPSLGGMGGIWSSPFTPHPNELQSMSPDRPSTARQLSPLQLATHEQQAQTAVALDEMTSFASSARNSWGAPPSQPVSQMLQDTLAQQYAQFPQSSGFTNTSSIYENNTPALGTRNVGRNVSRAGFNGNNTTMYTGASDFDRTTMLQSSIWPGSQPSGWQYNQTPPGGQGG